MMMTACKQYDNCCHCHQVNLADFTDNHWVTCFQETAEQILGKKADELGELKDNVSYDSIVHSIIQHELNILNVQSMAVELMH